MGRNLSIQERMAINKDCYGAEEYFYDVFYNKYYKDGGYCFKYGLDDIMKNMENSNSFTPVLPFINYTPDYVCQSGGKLYMVECKGFVDTFFLKQKPLKYYKQWNDICPVYFFLKEYSENKYNKSSAFLSLDRICRMIKKTRENIKGDGQEYLYPLGYHLPRKDDPKCYEIPFKDLLGEMHNES